MSTLLNDLRFALRQMRRAPGFATITILTLALGIGSATAVFSVVDAVLLRPLPFAHQDRLVAPETRAQSGYTQPWSYLSYLDARAQQHSFSAFAGYNDFTRINLESPSGPLSVPAVKGTDNFFDVFGVKALLGRTFLPGEDQPGRDDVAVLSYFIWQTQFGGQRDVVGKVIRLDGTPYTVIGVMPSTFRFPLSAEKAIYTPLHPDAAWKSNRGSHWMSTVALLKPGVSLPQAQADMAAVLRNLARSYPGTDEGRTVKLLPLGTSINRQTRPALLTLLLAVFALLAIACVNVAGLLLARGVKREREMAVRSAVGARRTRLVRQLITESLLFSFFGLVGGVLLSFALLALMRNFLIEAMARGTDVQLNAPILLVALVVASATGLLASLLPALRLSGLEPNQALRPSGGMGATRAQHRVRSSFVITQVALSLVLLIISGVLLRNLRELFHAQLGFQPDHILYEPIDLSPGRYENRDPLTSFYQPLVERASHLPGVQAAGLINVIPIQSYGSNQDVHIAGQPPYPPNQEMLAEMRFVTPGYFDVFGIHLLRGRMLSASLDRPENKAGSIVVNQAFQRKFFSAGGTPLGARLDDNDKPDEKTGIVGLVTDVRQDLHSPTLAEMDWLLDSLPVKDRTTYLMNLKLVLRVAPGTSLAGPLRGIIHDLDPTVPFTTPESMAEVISESLIFERLVNWLFGIFAGLALLLAVIGLYGLISHEVSLRTREIGVRMALGSTRARVAGEVLARVGLLLTLGLAAGWVLTLALQRVLAAVVVLHAGTDGPLLAGITALLALCGLFATLRPAHTASSVQPTEALRAE